MNLLEKRIGAQLWGSTAGKSRIAKRLIQMIPEHKIYVESFAGGAAVFWGKDKSQVEVLNDIDVDIAGALEFIKNISSGDIVELKRMNWKISEEWHKKLRNSSPKSSAGRFHRMAMLRFAGFMCNPNHGMNRRHIGMTLNLFDRIPQAKERLKNVKVYNEDYQKVMKRYDGSDTFFFLDPPYTKTDQKVGERSFDHKAFWRFLETIKGKFLVTYDSTDPAKRFSAKILRYGAGDRTEGTHKYKTYLITNYKTKRIIEKGIDPIELLDLFLN